MQKYFRVCVIQRSISFFSVMQRVLIALRSVQSGVVATRSHPERLKESSHAINDRHILIILWRSASLRRTRWWTDSHSACPCCHRHSRACDPGAKSFMNTRRSGRLALMLIATVAATGCASKKQSGAAIGAGVGAGVGAVIGNQTGSTARGAIIGAAVGGAAGAVIGHMIIRQETLAIPGATESVLARNSSHIASDCCNFDSDAFVRWAVTSESGAILPSIPKRTCYCRTYRRTGSDD